MQNKTQTSRQQKLDFIIKHQLQHPDYSVITLTEDSLHVVCCQPLCRQRIQQLQTKTQRNVHTTVVTDEQLQHHIQFTSFSLQYALAQKQQTLKDQQTITLCNTIIEHAIQTNSSDIHLEPHAQHCRIRFRIDGLLKTITTLAPQHAQRLTARFKVIAKMDIAEKRLPQDGRFHYHFKNSQWDCRVNGCPCQLGEKLVIRILHHDKTVYPLTSLGLLKQQVEVIQQSINQPQGLILVTGPTGSGKTQTCYSLLQCLNNPARNIITIEDPIEIDIEDVTQIQTKTAIGLDFSTLLRAVLRQDPDIIMLGEIRDLKTASMAVRAAHTGHLVLATLHTNSAHQAITRLIHMGIAHFQIASCLNCIIAQRLVRKRCERCNNAHDTEGVQTQGCEHCHHGYSGRLGLFEVIPQTRDLTQLVLQQDWSAIENYQQTHGLMTLWQTAQHRILQGETTLSEAHRVVHHDD